ncbi:MAG TPA: hypothetical protein VF282_00160 [Bacillota bacterium]
MPTTTSFDAIWRAMEDAVDDSLGTHVQVTDHALWVEILRGDRKYDLRLALGDAVSGTITLEQDALNAAVDAGSLEQSDETPGGCSVIVEFCVVRNGEPGAAVALLRHVIEEFWPDVQISYTRLDESAPPGSDYGDAVHEHFSFMRPVGFDFADRVEDFVAAVARTLEQLAAIAER